MIKYMSLYNIPLQEEGACAMFRKLAIETAKMDGRDITNTGRWNGIRNEDGSATGNYQNAIVCGHHFFLNFLKRNPVVRKYRTATMSLMRAKKATPEVFVLFLPACLPVASCLALILTMCVFCYLFCCADSQSSF